MRRKYVVSPETSNKLIFDHISAEYDETLDCAIKTHHWHQAIKEIKEKEGVVIFANPSSEDMLTVLEFIHEIAKIDDGALLSTEEPVLIIRVLRKGKWIPYSFDSGVHSQIL